MRDAHRIAAWCLLPLLACCGQKGGLYLPDANRAPVHKASVTPAPPSTPAPSSTPAPPSTPAPATEPAASPDATPPADDPTTRRKIPTTPDPASSQ